MSEALERVIAEQQKEIDRLRAQQENQLTYNIKDFKAKEDIMTIAAQIAKWRKLRDCWKAEKKNEWNEFRALCHGLDMALLDYGFCIYCCSLSCSGDCNAE